MGKQAEGELEDDEDSDEEDNMEFATVIGKILKVQAMYILF